MSDRASKRDAAICTTCHRPVDHAGNTYWYADKDWVLCVPCQDAASPVGRLRQQVVDLTLERDAVIRERDELRAVLAPLLDDPLDRTCSDGSRCRVCGHVALSYGRPSMTGAEIERSWHEPDCPVLRRDTLLGRPGG